MSPNERQATALADAFRTEHALGVLPIKDVFELVHVAAQVDVFSIEAADEEHGLTMIDPQSGRLVIVVATTRNPMRQRSSVAHELGHLLRRDLDSPEPCVPGERSPAEICADAFARHLLLPRAAVRSRLAAASSADSLAALSDLVQEFEVSPAIAAIQMKNAGLITVELCSEWQRLTSRQLAAQFGWLSQYEALAEASAKPRAPQRLMQRAVAGYKAGVLSITELAEWYGQSADTLRDELGEPEQARPDTADDDWDLDAPLFPETNGDA